MLHKLPLSRKVALIILLSNGILLATVLLVTGIWNVNTIRDSSVKVAQSSAYAFGQDFTKIIIFDSPHIAADTVSRLRALDSIKNVFLFNAQGKPVFSYFDSAEFKIDPPPVLPPQYYFKDGYLHVYSNVSYEGKTHGTVYYRMSTDLLDSAVSSFAFSLLAFITIIIAVSLFISFNLQKVITRPIVELANVANQVLKHNDLSKRAHTSEKNEIGQLYDDFNLMVEGIEKRSRILEQKNKELEMHRNELEKLVEERTSEIAEYVRELETFSYSVSHDLRSPLRSINGFGNILLEQYQDKLDDEGKYLLKRIVASSNRMGDLIDDLLLLSRINQCDISKEQINLSAIVQDVLEQYENFKENEDKVNLIMQSDIQLYADANLMRIVMDNLINNAIKYKAVDDILNLEIGSQNEQDATLVYVKDNGIGFDMKYSDRIFNPFQRLHSNEDYEGTGIGLATVKRIMERQNGTVWVQSAEKQGTTFYLKLPGIVS